MFTITGKENGIIWDNENNRPLVKFIKGSATVEGEETANRLTDLGYAVDGDFSDPLTRMTVKELKEYATENGIKLGDVKKKQEIIDLINSNLEATDEVADEDEQEVTPNLEATDDGNVS